MRVSIVIPCYNVAAWLPTSMDAALAGSHPDSEIIAVDDGSSDGTLDLLQTYAGRNPQRVRVLSQPNRGASAARNVGLRECTGTYVQFLDADDTLLPDKIRDQVALAEREGSPELIIGDYCAVMPNGLLLRTQALYDRPWMALIRTRMGTTSANLWRRDAVLAAGGWPEELASSQDYALLFAMLRNGARVAWDHCEATEVHKRESGSISRTGLRGNWERYIALRKAIKEHLVTLGRERHKEELATLDQYVFMALRILATYDLQAARRAFRSIIDRGFVPEVSRAITERYVLLYDLLGFSCAERALRLVRRSRPLAR
ncbi:MAG: glycosyltransferase family 2 protein [Flavobacteriales bacterium]|nr:glycosyltransferase family 2 protein [Flavobacteriales bacterium]